MTWSSSLTPTRDMPTERSSAKTARQELAKLQVEVNEEKSTTVELARGESFGLLGFDFRRVRWLPGVATPYTPELKKRTAVLADLTSPVASDPNRWVG